MTYELRNVDLRFVLADGDLLFEKSDSNERHVRGSRYRTGGTQQTRMFN